MSAAQGSCDCTLVNLQSWDPCNNCPLGGPDDLCARCCCDGKTHRSWHSTLHGACYCNKCTKLQFMHTFAVEQSSVEKMLSLWFTRVRQKANHKLGSTRILSQASDLSLNMMKSGFNLRTPIMWSHSSGTTLLPLYRSRWEKVHITTDVAHHHSRFENKKLSWCWQTYATHLEVSQGHHS